jgi:hypothetical protein
VANRIKLAGTTSTSFQIGLQKVTLDTTQISSPYTLNLPSGVGTAGQKLVTDGSGNLSWVNSYSLPTASTSTLGGVKVDGVTITVNGSGVIQANYSTTLAGLTDVNVTSPTNNQVLTYSSSTNKWIPTTVNGVSTLPTGIAYYGNFYDTTNQTPASTTVAYALNIGSSTGNNGVTLSNGSRINFSYAGTYNVTYSIQFTNTDSHGQNVDVWMRQNGTDIADSNSIFQIPSKQSGNGFLIAVTPIMVTVAAGDYVEIMYAVSSTSVTVITTAAQTNPTVPITPGVIVTVEPVTALIVPTTVTNLTATGSISANTFIPAFTTVVSAGGTTTLTAASPHYIWITGTSTQTIKLPDATTLTVGQVWYVNNDSTQSVTVNDGSGTFLATVLSGAAVDFTALSISSAAGTWGYYGYIPDTVTWGDTALTLGSGSTVTATTFVGALTGNASTATKLATARNINGVAFDGSAAITVTADASTLTGTTLNSTVVSSSLTSVGTLSSLAVTNSSATPVTVTYTPATRTGVAILSTGKDTVGGTGYFDFLRATNTTSGVVSGSKTMRLNNVGTLEILNSAYNATILSITDNGFVAINTATGVSNGIPTNNGIAMNSNSYIYDDGNYHLTSKAGSIWLNANDGSAVNINTQMPSGITGGGLNVQGAVKSYASGAAATAFISGAGAISGVALQLDSGTAGTAANMAVRDTSTVASTMYFDVSTGGSANGTFKFRSSSSFNEILTLTNTTVTVNKQMLIGGGSQSAYVNINSTNTYNVNGPYGYLNTGGAGGINSSGSSGSVGWSLYSSGRIQSSEVDVTSDERLKDIQGVIPLDKALQFVRTVDGILYTWKPGFGDDGLKAGFGAQSVHKAGFDHMIAPIPNDRVEGTVDDDGWTHPDKVQLTIGYNQAIPYHHEVIKHLLDRIEQLEATVASLTK